MTGAFEQLVADAVRVAVRAELSVIQTQPTNRLRSAEEASEYLNLSKREIYNMIANGELPVVTHGKRKMLDTYDLNAWIDRNKSPC